MHLSLAPIQGMTVAHYRNHFAEIFGHIDDYYAPFIATSEKKHSSPLLFQDIEPAINDDHLKIIPQLLSNNGEDFNFYASKIVAMGHKEINWNIGCSFPVVTKKKRGSGILPYPEMIESFLDEVCAVKDYDLTVKMRLGQSELSEGQKVIEILNHYPLKGVMIHGRTGIQKYEGHSDLDAFEILAANCQHDVTYNGDIFTVEDYKRISSRFPSVKNFMLGRGALRDPFLPSKIKGVHLPRNEQLSKLKEFHDAVYLYYKNKVSGDHLLCGRMKEFWLYMSVHLDPTGKYFEQIKKTHNSKDYLNIVEKLFIAIE